MRKYYELWPFNFGAIHSQNFAEAKIIIVPVPYEGTVSFNVGTSNGPYNIIANSRYLDELFDSQGSQLIDLKSTDIFTLNELELSKNSPKETLKGVEQAITQEVLKYDKFPLMLGGEHSITYGAIKAVKKRFKDVSVLQFDAHTDLLSSHEGCKYSHACVMRRIHDLNISSVSVGIRNINAEVKNYINKNKIKYIYQAPEMPSIDQITKGLTKNVYLTFDLDCLDPSIMPSVGTPEPGGLGWYDVIDIIEKVSRKVNLVGADVVELKPIPGLDAPDFLAAKLVYHIIKSKIQSISDK